jgi:hypothetical protein
MTYPCPLEIQRRKMSAGTFLNPNGRRNLRPFRTPMLQKTDAYNTKAFVRHGEPLQSVRSLKGYYVTIVRLVGNTRSSRRRLRGKFHEPQLGPVMPPQSVGLVWRLYARL